MRFITRSVSDWSNRDCPAPARRMASTRSTRGDVLEQVASGTRHDRGHQRLVVGIRGQHQARDLRLLRPDLAAGFHPAAIGQPDVEDGHIGLRRWDASKGFFDRARLADHINVLGGLEECPKTGSNDLVIVEQEYSHRAIVPAPAVNRRHLAATAPKLEE